MGSQPRIVAGDCSDIHWGSGEWIIVDMGFSNTKQSCGVAIGDSTPRKMRYGDLVKKVIKAAQEDKREYLNLLLEAPLSMAFNTCENPVRRSFEEVKHEWYLRAGATTMLGAIYLIDRLNASDSICKVRLFEGFAPLSKVDHAKIAGALRKVVKQRIDDRIVKPCDILKRESGCVTPAYRVTNGDGKIPPVVRLLQSDLC
jgi:hypothetical protein